MSNTLSSSLILDKLSEAIITTLPNRLAPLRAFSRDFGVAEMNQGNGVQVKKYSGTSAVQTNPTDFEAGDTTADNVRVVVNHINKGWHLTSAELNQGFKLLDAATINAQTFADKIIDLALAPVTATNFPTNVTIAEASFSTTNLAAIWAAVAKSSQKNLFLGATAMSKLIPTSQESFKLMQAGAYGFDGIFLNTRWTGAGANIYGFACGPEAVAVASGIPVQAPNASQGGLESRIVTLEQLGLSVQVNTWFSLKTRSQWASMDVMFGAALGDNTAGAHIKSA